MPGNIKLVAEKGPHALHLQDALAVVHDSQLILAHQFTATLSSDELKNAVKQKIDFRFTAFFILSGVIPYNAIAVSFQDYS